MCTSKIMNTNDTGTAFFDFVGKSGMSDNLVEHSRMCFFLRIDFFAVCKRYKKLTDLMVSRELSR